jgi:hypothetical protein
VKQNKDPLTNRTDDVSIHRQDWRLVRAYDQTAISFTIRSCFRKVGLSPDTQLRRFKIEFDNMISRENGGVKELCDQYLSIEDFSSRQQVQMVGMLNAEFWEE